MDTCVSCADLVYYIRSISQSISTNKILHNKKSKALLIPYFVFGLLYEILWSLLGLNQWIGIIFTNSIKIPLNGALWFFPALLFAEVISFVLMKFLTKKISYICIAMIALIGSKGIVLLPFSLDSVFVGIG